MTARWIGKISVDLAVVVGPCSRETAWGEMEAAVRRVIGAESETIEIETIEATSLELEADVS